MIISSGNCRISGIAKDAEEEDLGHHARVGWYRFFFREEVGILLFSYSGSAVCR